MTDECRLPFCDNDARGYQEGVNAYGAKFCSTEHEIKYDHLRADVR